MAKDQFQSTEPLEIRLPPFVSTTDGSEVTDETNVILKITKPDKTTLTDVQLSRAENVDPNTGFWYYTLPTTNYQKGTWLVKALSVGGTPAFNQRRVYTWGDYVDAFMTLATSLELIQNDVTILKKIGTGRWRVTSDNQFLIYDDDGSTVLYRFALKDLMGRPTNINIYERLPL